jgi:hypothetical protein
MSIKGRKIFTEEARAKMSIAKLRKKLSAQHRMSISTGLKGKRSPRGKKVSEERLVQLREEINDMDYVQFALNKIVDVLVEDTIQHIEMERG